MQEKTIFTLIIEGEIPAHKIYEDDRVIAFLDIHPINEGHTLVVPKKQVDHIWDMDDDDYEYLWKVAKKISRHIHEIIQPKRVGVIVEGFGVPHAHIHLIPINESNDIKVIPDLDANPNHEALVQTAEKLRV